MFERLCYDLLDELLITKYNLLLSIQLSNLQKKHVHSYKNNVKERKEKKKKKWNNKQDSLFKFKDFTFVLEKEKYYTHFMNVKKKKRKKKEIYKKLRKQILDLNIYCKKVISKKKNNNVKKLNEYNSSYTSNKYYKYQFLKLFLYNYEKRNFFLFKKCITFIKKVYYVHNKTVEKLKKNILYNDNLKKLAKIKKKNNQEYFIYSKKKKKKTNNYYYNSQHYLRNELGKYMSKKFYNFFPNYNFEEQELEERNNGEERQWNAMTKGNTRIKNTFRNNNLNCMLSNTKQIKNGFLNKKKEIKSKIYINNKTTIYLSSKKLNKNYNSFLKKFNLFINKLRLNKERDMKKEHAVNSNLVNALLYLKQDHSINSSISNISSNKQPCINNNENKVDNDVKSKLDKKCVYKKHISIEETEKNILIKNKRIYNFSEVITIINNLKTYLGVIRMDIFYISIYFISFMNNILKKIKNYK
ncbi:hypothetical protein HEP_00108000 [Hepatocystis sp. ex Piliocolobus tephrosceles]|nr:hypothetical protein HEP_00108000 [Hepatocystis sp. ex Piliocolobus tephrosceles]